MMERAERAGGRPAFQTKGRVPVREDYGIILVREEGNDEALWEETGGKETGA